MPFVMRNPHDVASHCKNSLRMRLRFKHGQWLQLIAQRLKALQGIVWCNAMWGIFARDSLEFYNVLVDSTGIQGARSTSRIWMAPSNRFANIMNTWGCYSNNFIEYGFVKELLWSHPLLRSWWTQAIDIQLQGNRLDYSMLVRLPLPQCFWLDGTQTMKLRQN